MVLCRGVPLLCSPLWSVNNKVHNYQLLCVKQKTIVIVVHSSYCQKHCFVWVFTKQNRTGENYFWNYVTINKGFLLLGFLSFSNLHLCRTLQKIDLWLFLTIPCPLLAIAIHITKSFTVVFVIYQLEHSAELTM